MTSEENTTSDIHSSRGSKVPVLFRVLAAAVGKTLALLAAVAAVLDASVNVLVNWNTLRPIVERASLSFTEFASGLVSVLVKITIETLVFAFTSFVVAAGVLSLMIMSWEIAASITERVRERKFVAAYVDWRIRSLFVRFRSSDPETRSQVSPTVFSILVLAMAIAVGLIRMIPVQYHDGLVNLSIAITMIYVFGAIIRHTRLYSPVAEVNLGLLVTSDDVWSGDRVALSKIICSKASADLIVRSINKYAKARGGEPDSGGSGLFAIEYDPERDVFVFLSYIVGQFGSHRIDRTLTLCSSGEQWCLEKCVVRKDPRPEGVEAALEQKDLSSYRRILLPKTITGFSYTSIGQKRIVATHAAETPKTAQMGVAQ